MSNLDKQFMDVMAGMQDAYAKAEVIDDWMPDLGDYQVLLGAAKSGVSTKDGKSTPWVRLPGTLICPGEPNDGRTFGVGYYTDKSLAALKRDVAILSGRSVASITEALNILAGVEGWIAQVNVSEWKNKTTKATRRIPKIVDVIERGIPSTAEPVSETQPA